MIFVYLNRAGSHAGLEGVKFPVLVKAKVLESAPKVMYIDDKEVGRIGAFSSQRVCNDVFFDMEDTSPLGSEFNLVVRPVKTIQDAPSGMQGPQFDFNLLYEARGDHLWASSSWTVKDDTGKDFKLESDGKVLCLNDRESGTTTIFKEVHHAV